MPVILAGGLIPANVAAALRGDAGDRRRRRVGRRSAARSPASDRARTRCAVALFVKRARAARLDRPNLAVRPTPVAPGPARGRRRRTLGRRARVRRPLRPGDAHGGPRQLEAAYAAIRHDPRFWADLRELLARYAGRPTAALPRRPARLRDARAGRRPRPAARLPHRLRLYLKREDLAHTGAHKINNALGQALLTRRLGKTRVIAETGAGQHGVATATACALLGLPCVVFMGAEDIERQQPNVLRMRALGRRGPARHLRHAPRSRTPSTRRCATG